jgi:hypothetical protein
MAARLAPTNVEPSTAGQQAAGIFDLVEPVIVAAGYRRLIYTTDHLSGDIRCGVYTFPPLDPYDSRAEFMVMMVNASNQFRFNQLYDWNTQSAIPAHNTFSASLGNWSGGTWPTSGTPANAVSISATGSSIQPDGNSRYTIRAIASEYGVMVVASGGGNVDWIGLERPMCPVRSGREIQVVAQATSNFPLTFGAPSGAVSAHVRFRAEGNNFDVTFPTATALTSFRIAQEITRTGGGFIEAYVRTRAGAARDELVVRIPPERAPAAPYSTTRPQIAVTYQDPATQTAGLTFEIAAGAWTVVAANPGSIHRLGVNFPLLNVRRGATVRNHTANQSLTITGFTQTVAVDDTAALGDTTTWTSSDDIEVYPGPEEHGFGYGTIGGHWQAVLQGAETSNITAGADRVVILNDRYGEAQGQFAVGQNTIIANSGRAAVFGLTGVTGTFVRNEEIVSSVGTRGRIRGIAGANLAVDTTQGRTVSGIPWATTHTITGQESGATATINTITAGTTDVGWFQTAPILAIGQVNVAGGDYRTTLTLDMDHVTFNPSFTARPCMAVGLRAKVLLMPTEVATTITTVPSLIGSTALNDDVNRHETPLTTEPAHEPDHETGSLMLCEHGLTFNTGNAWAEEIMGPRIHVRSVNARGTTADVGTLLYEDGDANRKWTVIDLYTSAAIGAGGSPATTWWACLGPTD